MPCLDPSMQHNGWDLKSCLMRNNFHLAFKIWWDLIPQLCALPPYFTHVFFPDSRTVVYWLSFWGKLKEKAWDARSIKKPGFHCPLHLIFIYGQFLLRRAKKTPFCVHFIDGKNVVCKITGSLLLIFWRNRCSHHLIFGENAQFWI